MSAVTNATLSDESRWAAVLSKDRRQDGRFFFAVATTGVFCKPSCPSRAPRRRNVRFFDTGRDALRHGFRPCRRCRPLEPAAASKTAASVRAACAYIRAHPDETIPLRTLASHAGVSPFHFQRTFKSMVGLTPKQYADACRLQELKSGLRTERSVTDAIYGAGYGSSSRVYARVDTRLGMTPSEYRSGGRELAISCASSDTPLGRLMVAATDRGVCFVRFGDSQAGLLGMLRKEFPAARIHAMRKPYPPQFEAWMSAVQQRLSAAPSSPEIPLDVRATAFQTQVWSYLQSIPAGEVRSYADVARGIGRPAAARAVARACASNPVALVIPCHRVIRGDGSPGGYRWGLDRKQALLDRERR